MRTIAPAGNEFNGSCHVCALILANDVLDAFTQQVRYVIYNVRCTPRLVSVKLVSDSQSFLYEKLGPSDISFTSAPKIFSNCGAISKKCNRILYEMCHQLTLRSV